jgi:hypothetical protein
LHPAERKLDRKVTAGARARTPVSWTRRPHDLCAPVESISTACSPASAVNAPPSAPASASRCKGAGLRVGLGVDGSIVEQSRLRFQPPLHGVDDERAQTCTGRADSGPPRSAVEACAAAPQTHSARGRLVREACVMALRFLIVDDAENRTFRSCPLRRAARAG